MIDEPIGRSLNRDITSGEKVEAELDFLISRRDQQRRQTEGERLEEAQLLVSQLGNSNDRRRLERLERLLEASEEEEAWGRWNPDDLAILAEAEDMIGGPDDSGPPRGSEFFELAIARALERRGRTAPEISETMAGWLADFEERRGG